MATNQQHDQEIPTIVPQSESERIEEIDVAQADESDRYVIAKHLLNEDAIHSYVIVGKLMMKGTFTPKTSTTNDWLEMTKTMRKIPSILVCQNR